MRANFDYALAEVLGHEGGFVDHSKDPGGATNKGITLATLRAWRGDPRLPVSELINIGAAEVAEIYFKRFWKAVNGDLLPHGLDLAVFDFAVNSGVARAVKQLQQLVGFKGKDVDGVLGVMTLKAIERDPRGADWLASRLCWRRQSWLERLRHWRTFGKGWTRRVSRVEQVAIMWAWHGGARGAIAAGAVAA